MCLFLLTTPTIWFCHFEIARLPHELCHDASQNVLNIEKHWRMTSSICILVLYIKMIQPNGACELHIWFAYGEYCMQSTSKNVLQKIEKLAINRKHLRIFVEYNWAKAQCESVCGCFFVIAFSRRPFPFIFPLLLESKYLSIQFLRLLICRPLSASLRHTHTKNT